MLVLDGSISFDDGGEDSREVARGSVQKPESRARATESDLRTGWIAECQRV